MTNKKPSLEQLKKLINSAKCPEKMRIKYVRHNARCRELGLDRLTEQDLKNQGCAYLGGYPA